MSLPVVYRRKVGRDLADYFGWYNEQRDGLGEEFLSAVDAVFDTIEQYPELFARIHGGGVVVLFSLGFPMPSSIASNQSVSWFSRSCILRVIRRSGRGLDGQRANNPLQATRWNSQFVCNRQAPRAPERERWAPQ